MMKSKKIKIGIAVLALMVILYQAVIFISRSSFGPNVYSFLLILGIVALAILVKSYPSPKDSEKNDGN